MKKMILVLWVGALLAGCGEKTQTSDSEVNESPSTIKVFSLGSPKSVISVKQTTAGPRYYFDAKEIALRDIRASLSRFPEKKVLLRPDEGISFSILQEVWIEVAIGGQVEVVFEVPASSGNSPPEELTLPFTGIPRPSTFKPMPRISVEIGELGDVYLNGGSLIEDGFDPDMKELTSLLRRERELRDQMIQSGRASREVAELFVNISCHPTTEYRALANVFNACLAAEVNHFYPPNFGPRPLDMLRQKKQLVVQLKQRQKKLAPRVESTSKTKESSDLTAPKVSRPSTVASTTLSSVGLALPKPMQNR